MQKSITSPRYTALIAWLKQARVDRDITMRELAATLGKPHSFVQKVEILERRLDVHEYTVYCEALGVDPKQGIDILTKSV